MNKLILLLLLLLLAACAGMDKDECQLADWQAMGYQQGARGQSAATFEKYQKDCSKHQIKADFNAFKRGHAQGLQEYCTYEQGLNSGSSGVNYNNQCASNRYPQFESGYHAGLNRYCTYDSGYRAGQGGQGVNRNCPRSEYPGFVDGHADGYAKYEVIQAIRTVEGQLASLSDSIQAESDYEVDAAAAIVSGDSTPTDRVQALQDMKFHQEEKKRLEQEYYEAENELARLQSRLSNM